MKAEAVMFANRAAIEGSMLTVKGAGWEHFDVQMFPSTVRGFAPVAAPRPPRPKAGEPS